MRNKTRYSVSEPAVNADFADGFVSCGGFGMPDFSGTPDRSVVFTCATDTTFPGETISLTGSGLDGISVFIWSEGTAKELCPVRSDATKAQIIIPPFFRRSVTFIWPVKNRVAGEPYAINLPQVWWTDRQTLLSQEKTHRIRLFGTNFTLDGCPPTVAVITSDGRKECATVVSFSRYDITAEINSDISECEAVKMSVHNGTGGRYGWSGTVTVGVSNERVTFPDALSLIKLSDPVPGADETKKIKAAIHQAEQSGGAVIQLGQGEYCVSEAIKIDGDYPFGLVIRGAGRGTYDFASMLRPSESGHRGLTGTFSSVRFTDGDVPPNIFDIRSDNVTLENMTVFGADGHVGGYTMKFGYTVVLSGNNETISNLRMIKADLRDLNTGHDSSLMCSNNLFIDVGCRDIKVTGCEFHTKACAVWINFYDGDRYCQHVLFDDSRQVRNVLISDCCFYGYTHPYVGPNGERPKYDEGEISRGITAMNVDGLIVENCLFKGMDQKNDIVLTRSMYIPITANHMFIAHNVMFDVGSTPGTGFDGNTGEQILLHGGFHLGGIYNVKASEGKRLTVRRDNIPLFDKNGRMYTSEDTVTNAGSRILDGLKMGTRGMAYICSGKGAGQVRQIDGYEETADQYVFILHEPWKSEPDSGSIVVETAPFRENIIFSNTIMKEEPTMAQGFKSGGVLVFFDTYKNIIAQNDFRNLAFGVAVNSAFKCPVTWCTVRDNRFSGIREAYKDAMQGGDSARNATCFCESVVSNAGETAGWDDYNVWYTVGNVFRGNICEDCDTAVELATNRWNNIRNHGLEEYHGNEKGACMTTVENNYFADVSQGILVGNPAYWSYLRNNKFSFLTRPGFSSSEICFDHDPINFRLINIENDIITADSCRTSNRNADSVDTGNGVKKPETALIREYMGKIIEYLGIHYRENIRLDDIASECHLNKYYISHFFKANMNCSVGEYVNNLRLQKSCDLLLTTDEPIYSIAYAVGFSDVSNFGRHFRKIFSVSPSEFRNNNG